MLKSDWNFCKEKALQLLLKQESLSFPVEPQRLNTGLSIYFDSIQGYCHTVGLPVSIFCNVQMLQDGCTIFSKDHSFYLILYNEWDKSPYRRQFTLAHELGHILLSHCNDNANSEKLANQFASHLLLPRAALSYIKQRVPFPVLTQLVPFFWGIRYSLTLCMERCITLWPLFPIRNSTHSEDTFIIGYTHFPFIRTNRFP